MTALLWAGIESLFQINAELRFRLATLIALTLEPRGEACLVDRCEACGVRTPRHTICDVRGAAIGEDATRRKCLRLTGRNGSCSWSNHDRR